MTDHGPSRDVQPPPEASGWSAAVLRTANRLEPSGDPSGVIYGTIVAGSVIALLSRHTATAERLSFEVLGTLLVYWLAHGYCRALSQRYVHGTRLRSAEVGSALAHELGILKGGVAPVAVMVVAKLAGAELETAVWIALWTTVVLLFLAGIVAGIRSGARGPELALDGVVGGLFGLALVLLKATLH